MAFYRNRNNLEGNEIPQQETKGHLFTISNSSYNWANVVVSSSSTVLILILLIFKVSFTFEKSDVQNIFQVAASLSGLVLAIPLFLKDFDHKSNFWRHFFFLASVFIVATLLGVISSLQMNDSGSRVLSFYFVLFLCFSVSLNINTISIFFKRRKGNLASESDISFNATFNFIASFVVLTLGALLSSSFNVLTTFFVLSLYGFYLLLVMLVAILYELTVEKKHIDDEMCFAIESIVNQNKHVALSEQQLLDRLRNEKFPQSKEVVSRKKVQYLVAKMDSEINIDRPKLSIHSFDFVIPRWRAAYDNLLLHAQPHIIYKEAYSYDEKHFWELFKDDEIKYLLNVIAQASKLSVQLLEDNNSLVHKYKIIKSYKADFQPRHSSRLDWQRHYAVFMTELFYSDVVGNFKFSSYSDIENCIKIIHENTLHKNEEPVIRLVFNMFPIQNFIQSALNELYLTYDAVNVVGSIENPSTYAISKFYLEKLKKAEYREILLDGIILEIVMDFVFKYLKQKERKGLLVFTDGYHPIQKMWTVVQ